jgi:hypothetical protein
MAYFDRFGGLGHHGEDAARRASRRPRRAGQAGSRPQLTGTDLADIVRLIERKLTWYGFTSVKVGPFIQIRGGNLFIDLLERGEVLCRLELDPAMQTSTCSKAHGFVTLMNSLRGQSRRAAAA